jgi:hypothetical protein
MSVLVQLLLPTTPGNGMSSAAAMEALGATRRELAGTFGGLTAYVRSPAKGAWMSPDGHTEHDDVVMVEIVTDTFDRAWWRTYAAMLAGRFRQDVIHVRALRIELLDDEAR